MKDLLMKLTGLSSDVVDAGFVFLGSFVGALVSTRGDTSPFLVRFLNSFAGFVLASLTGLILLENHALPFLSSGISYLVGSVGYHLMNMVLNLAKMLEIDPFSTVGKIIQLIWTWKFPPLKK